VLARAALLLVALAAAGWLGSALGPARDEARALAQGRQAGGNLDAAQRREAIALLERARRRRPDSVVAPREAGLLLTDGRPAEAVALLRPLLRAEPENALGWTVLALALGSSDPAGARAAIARQRALAPPVKR
jgi:predicted Zn-dependent protease